MKRPLWIVGIVFAVLAGGITVHRAARDGEKEHGGGTADEQRERLRAFWDRFHDATEARVRGDFEAAAKGYRAALEIDPRHQDSLFYLAVCLQESGRYREAAALLRKLTELYPDHNPGFSQLGSVLSLVAPGAEPDFEAAAAAFQKSLEINREHSGPFLARGRLELERGRFAEAGELFAVAADAGAPEGLFLQGLTSYLHGDDEEALPLFARTLESNAREKAITGRGILSEGDVKSGREGAPLASIEKAGILSLVFASWTAHRRGSYPADFPEAFRLDLSSREEARARYESIPLPGDVFARGAWLDVDGDGRHELLLTGPSQTRLLRHSSGAWRDITERAAMDGRGAWSALVFDLDADGRDDVYLIRSGYVGTGQNTLLHNRGGRFDDVTDAWSLSGRRATSEVLALDADNDGRVDLLEVGSANGSQEPVRLYLQREGRFEECARELGLTYERHAVDAAVADADADGRQDLFILGWKAPGRWFRNTESGFEDATEEVGLSGVGGDGLSALLLDYDRDGDPDLLVTSHAPLERSLQRLVGSVTLVGSVASESRGGRHASRLFENQKGRFQEVTSSGLEGSYGVVQAVECDLDGDDWPDLLFALGGLEATHLEPSVVLRNVEGRFVEWAYVPSIQEPVRSTGAAVSDIDGDGRFEIFLSGAGLFRLRSP